MLIQVSVRACSLSGFFFPLLLYELYALRGTRSLFLCVIKRKCVRAHSVACVALGYRCAAWGHRRRASLGTMLPADMLPPACVCFLCSQFMAVCVVVFIRRRALQRAHAFEGVTVHRTRDGWLSLENDSDSDNEQADNQVGLPSYDEICRDEGPPSYDAVPGATGAQARPSSPPPPMSPRESSATTTASPRVSSTLGL